MKILSQDELNQHNNATVRGAVEGTLAGLAVSIPGSLILNRRWGYYRSLPLSLKMLGAIFVTVPALAIQAERRGLEFDRSQWSGFGKVEMDREAQEAREAWEALSAKNKISNWLINHQYSVMAGGWLGTGAIAGTIIWRNKYQTTPQKLVQVRMWAQAMAVGLILAGGLLTHRAQLDSASKPRATDHSWAAILEEQAQEEEQRKVKLMAAAPASA
ncbi:hypothetical protein HWV62_32333 [Athelia sp. TMB]|nr:hypothetical protein HWV62_32333 [Athelia sp. TMB]